MEKHLHIVCLNVPYPVNYGGVFDLFYKLPALQAAGVNIHLHCFCYGRGTQDELNKYCVSVNYYERRKGHKSISTSLPYIVASRKNDELLNNLLQDDYPIFMEGIHCTYLLNDERFAKRRKFVRIHNVEYQYYHDLYKTATSPFKKLYYWRESRLLKHYEAVIADKATAYWGVTHKDVAYYRSEYQCKTIEYLPLYIPPTWVVKGITGIGNFFLYQADLSVDANEKAAVWLLEKVFSKIEVPFVIAGKNPSEKLQRLAHTQLHTCIVINPSEREMQDMIAKAHVNILPSFHSTGIKLKLLNALYNGRHCLVNTATVDGSGLESLCHIANTANEFVAAVQAIENLPFVVEDLQLREIALKEMFNNTANAAQQVKWIWTDHA
ncbi:MAG: glycosyltransferase family 4 protein [Flavobacterium sp.]|nr:glycosyltransferase family 4 protein [Flavobacterium sp.]